MPTILSVLNDLFIGVSSNSITAFLDKPWTAHVMFYVVNAFFLALFFSWKQSFAVNSAALGFQRKSWVTRTVTVWLMPLLAFTVATGVLAIIVGNYEQMSAEYLRSADGALIHSSLLLLFTIIIFREVSTHGGLRSAVSGFFCVAPAPTRQSISVGD